MFTFCSSKSGLSVKRGISNELQFSVKRCFSVKHQFSATRRFSRTNSKIFNRKCCERSFVLDSFRENRIQVFNFCSFFLVNKRNFRLKVDFRSYQDFRPNVDFGQTLIFDQANIFGKSIYFPPFRLGWLRVKFNLGFF